MPNAREKQPNAGKKGNKSGGGGGNGGAQQIVPQNGKLCDIPPAYGEYETYIICTKPTLFWHETDPYSTKPNPRAKMCLVVL